MANLTEEIREELRRKILWVLKELDLFDSFTLSVSRADEAALIVTIMPKSRRSNIDPDFCQAITRKGRQCKIPPALGKKYCLTHLTMPKEEK